MVGSAFIVALSAASVVGTDAVVRGSGAAGRGPLDTSCYYPLPEGQPVTFTAVNSGAHIEHCYSPNGPTNEQIHDVINDAIGTMCERMDLCLAYCIVPGASKGAVYTPDQGQSLQCGSDDDAVSNLGKLGPVLCYRKDPPAIAAKADGGRSYRGLVSSTVSGRTCQKWTATEPHSETTQMVFTPDEEVDGEMTWGTGLGNHNYCRNPDGSMDKPWCYTLDPAVDREACEIDLCPSMKRNFPQEAEALATEVESRDCDCAEQLYGSTLTTKETAVPLVLSQKKGTLLRRGKGCPCPKP